MSFVSKYFLLISYHYGGLIPRRSPEQELLERVDLYTGERAEIGGNFKVLMQKLKKEEERRKKRNNLVSVCVLRGEFETERDAARTVGSPTSR